jgi:hypothetical protein
MAYAVLVNARPGDIARFERRGVKVVNLPGSRQRYGEVLAEAFIELREYRRDNAAPTLKPTDEKPLEQLLLPRDSISRLCFFAVSLDVLPFYRERAFPLAEAVGLVPITAADVVNLGDSISAKIDTLIDRAAVMCVDLSSPQARVELGMAMSRIKEPFQPDRQRLRLIAIASRLDEAMSYEKEIRVLIRPDLLSEDSVYFVQELAEIFQAVANELGIAQEMEPRRLYEAREYRAAVIAAMALLEATLRRRLDKAPLEEAQRPMSLRQLLYRAKHAGFEFPSDEEISAWVRLRNEAVHFGRGVTRNEALAVVESVERLLDINAP